MNSTTESDFTIGMDLGEKNHEVCVLDADGVVIGRVKVGCSPEAVAKFFELHRGALVAMETGTHSRWASRMAEAAGLSVLEMIEKHTETIRNFDRRIEEHVAKNPDAQRLMQVTGVGPLIVLAFVLTIEEAGRFEKSRTVGAFVGLAP